MSEQEILEHILGAPMIPREQGWDEIVQLYAKTLSNVASKLTMMELAEFVAVGMLVRQKRLTGDSSRALQAI
jgi:hypothetical protein